MRLCGSHINLRDTNEVDLHRGQNGDQSLTTCPERTGGDQSLFYMSYEKSARCFHMVHPFKDLLHREKNSYEKEKSTSAKYDTSVVHRLTFLTARWQHMYVSAMEVSLHTKTKSLCLGDVNFF